MKTTWHDIVNPIAARFEVAAAFDADVVHNAQGSAAVAKVLREMARIIDTEIEARKASRGAS